MTERKAPSQRRPPVRTVPLGIGSGTWFGFRPVRTRRPYEVAVEQIADAIRSGTLKVGDRLPAERVLSEQMQISRPTLRGAIKVLVDAGVLEVRRGPAGGMFIKAGTIPPDLSVGDREGLRMSEVAGVLEARRLLEPRVAQLAAVHARDHDFDAMSEAIDALRGVRRDRHLLLQLDTRFHLTIARATQNETVVELVRMLFHRLEFARELFRTEEDEPGYTINIHERTLRAIMSGHPSDVEAVMDEHLAQFERAWQQQTGRARIRRVPDFLLSLEDRPEPAPEGS